MKGCKSQDAKSQSRQKPHKPAKRRKSQNATCRKGTGNAVDAKSQSQKATKSRINQQKAEKPKSQEAKKPKSQEAKKQKSQEAKSGKNNTGEKKHPKINTPPKEVDMTGKQGEMKEKQRGTERDAKGQK